MVLFKFVQQYNSWHLLSAYYILDIVFCVILCSYSTKV